MKKTFTALRASIVLLLICTVLLGGAYPLVVFGFAKLAFPNASEGSLITHDGKVVGSTLLGQQFSHHKYFWGRLSATTPPYNAAASQGSNLNPANPKLLEQANTRIAALQKADPANKAPIPVTLITASGSGLDPHIGVADARYQISRVAAARHLKKETLAKLVEEHTEDRVLGPLGKKRVNVLELNLALDKLHPVK